MAARPRVQSPSPRMLLGLLDEALVLMDELPFEYCPSWVRDLVYVACTGDPWTTHDDGTRSTTSLLLAIAAIEGGA